jgi:hypothetical protein
VIIGINTNTCDLCTAFETVNLGFKLIMISDCVASAYGEDLHVFALQNIARCLGWVLTIPEFEEKLNPGIRRGVRNENPPENCPFKSPGTIPLEVQQDRREDRPLREEDLRENLGLES